MLVTGGYVLLTLLTLLFSFYFERSFSYFIWWVVLFLAPFSFVTVYLVLWWLQRRIQVDNDIKKLATIIHYMPHLLTFLLYFYNFFIFLTGIFYDQARAVDILEAMVLAMLMGAYLFFGFELAFYDLKERGFYINVNKPFPRFRTKLLVTFAVLAIFPLLFLVFKLMALTQDGGASSAQLMQSILITLGRVIVIVVISGVILAQNILRPIQNLTDKLFLLEKGDLSASTVVYTRDEFGIMNTRFNAMVNELRDKEKMRDLFGRFVSREVAEILMHKKVALGGEKSEATILFTDIRNFTTLSESLPPEKVVYYLNSYFSRMVGVIEKHRGFVNKFIGDAILAVFGAPINVDNPEKAAVACAQDMLDNVRDFNRWLEKDGLEPMAMGIGIHSGPVVMGNIGAENRMEYTVIGDTVNTASRLEAATKKMGVSLLVSEAAFAPVRNSWTSEEISPWQSKWIRLKGKKEPLKVHFRPESFEMDRDKQGSD